MIEFKFFCPHCGQHIQANVKLTGKLINCPACGISFPVPHPGRVAPPSAAGRTTRHMAADYAPLNLSISAPDTQPPGGEGGLVLPVLALVFSVLGLPGIVLGHIAIARLRKNHGRGNGMAVAGLIIGYLWLAVGLVALSMTAFRRGQDTSKTEAKATPKTETKTEPASTFCWNFDANTQGWTIGHGTSGLYWMRDGSNGCIYFQQTGDDVHIIADPSFFTAAGQMKYHGAGKDKIHVRVLPQGGTTAGHAMAVYFLTAKDHAWNEAKCVHTNFTAKDAWADVYLDMGANPVWASTKDAANGIANIRLDLDEINHGNRWVIGSIALER